MESLADQFIEAFRIISFVFTYFIYWAPIALGLIFWTMWREFLTKRYLSRIDWMLLEIKMPKDIRRSPLAMELVLNALYQGSSGSPFDRFLEGKVQDWFSLEIMSIEGDIHFFIRSPRIYKNFLESQIYSQYPSVEIHEVSDYAKNIKYTGDESTWQPFGIEYRLKEADYLPIATYVDFGLDREGVKDEERVDPLTTLLEFLGTCGKGEQIWIQIGVKVSGDRYHKKGTYFKKQNWVKEGEAAIDDINSKYTKEGGDAGELRMTEADKNKVKAISRNISKIGFDVGIRSFYWAHKNAKFDVSKIKGLVGVFRPFQLNAYNLISVGKVTDFDYPWQDFMNMRRQAIRRKMFSAYKRRSFFYTPYKKKPFVLNSEELATIFHFPGNVAETPTFGRIESRKGEPPTNLPV